MAENRILSDIIKSTFAIRKERLKLLRPVPKGDGTLTQDQFSKLYGLNGALCSFYLFEAGTDPVVQDRHPNYHAVTGIVRLVVGPEEDDREFLTGGAILGGIRRKIQWLKNEYVAAHGPIPAPMLVLLNGSVTAAERVASIEAVWDTSSRKAFQGNPADQSNSFSVDP